EQAVRGQALTFDSGASRETLLHDLFVRDEELRMQSEALADAHAELRQLNHRYRDLFENAPVGYLVADRATLILSVNERGAAVLDEQPAALVGDRLSRFLLPDDVVPFERYRREVAKSATPLEAEFTMVTLSGQRREVRLESVCTDRQTGEWRIALTDVTVYN